LWSLPLVDFWTISNKAVSSFALKSSFFILFPRENKSMPNLFVDQIDTNLKHMKYLIMDEVDSMFDQGLEKTVTAIKSFIPPASM
jgi:hypothetical protein